METEERANRQIICILSSYIHELECKTMNLKLELDTTRDTIQKLGKLLIYANYNQNIIYLPEDIKTPIQMENVYETN